MIAGPLTLAPVLWSAGLLFFTGLGGLLISRHLGRIYLALVFLQQVALLSFLAYRAFRPYPGTDALILIALGVTLIQTVTGGVLLGLVRRYRSTLDSGRADALTALSLLKF